ncbi:MAG TPA: hypothetical protein VM328_11690 [Fimbriimonadaceae bacterium]|nr:hypothetical protein [Fimbriimonadaceae bacterium]
MLTRPLAALLLLSILPLLALAGNGDVRLEAYPAMTVADGRSTVTISATVRTLGGSLVQDGTQVVFTTELGTFRESVVPTVNGVARAVFVAGSIPGTAKITASAFALNASATFDLELVGDKALLSSAREYIEVTAPRHLMYSLELKTIVASGPNKSIVVKYRDVTVEADDIQLTVPTYELRARKARYRSNAFDAEFDELYIQLNTRKGYGVTLFPDHELTIAGLGRGIAFVPGRQVERYGLASISSGGVKKLAPGESAPAEAFTFVELIDDPSLVAAKKAVAYPRREVQFHRAEIYVGGTRVMRMPLFQVNIHGTTPLLTDSIINVNDNQLAVNYPYYLDLRPGQTSLLRFRSGERYGRSGAGTRGAFLDYELSWNRGDDMDGGLTISSIGRRDWGIGLRQHLRFNERTSAFAYFDVASLKSVYGSGSLSHQLDGYQLSLSGYSNRTLKGPRYENQNAALVVEREPIKIEGLPVKLHYGLTATHQATKYQTGERSQTAVGLRARANMLPQTLDRDTVLNASFNVGRLMGHNVNRGLTLGASASLNRRVGRYANLFLTYDYADDGFNSSFLGRQNVSARAYVGAGNASLEAAMSKSLEIERSNLSLDASYKLGRDWKLYASYLDDHYIGYRYLEYNFTLGYTIGFREFGLTWSSRTKRFGIQVLGASFN